MYICFDQSKTVLRLGSINMPKNSHVSTKAVLMGNYKAAHSLSWILDFCHSIKNTLQGITELLFSVFPFFFFEEGGARGGGGKESKSNNVLFWRTSFPVKKNRKMYVRTSVTEKCLKQRSCIRRKKFHVLWATLEIRRKLDFILVMTHK